MKLDLYTQRRQIPNLIKALQALLEQLNAVHGCITNPFQWSKQRSHS